MRSCNNYLLVGLLGSIAVLARVAQGATQLGWADEFDSSFVYCKNTDCTVGSFYDGYVTQGSHLPKTWAYVGKQGSDPTGRSNAREHTNLAYRDDNTTGCSTQTAQIARYRTTSPPVDGSSCNVTVAYVTAASVTVDSCQFPNADLYYYHRMNPTLNFSAETATWTTVGYKSVVTQTDSLGGHRSDIGCFKILWQ